MPSPVILCLHKGKPLPQVTAHTNCWAPTGTRTPGPDSSLPASPACRLQTSQPGLHPQPKRTFQTKAPCRDFTPSAASASPLCGSQENHVAHWLTALPGQLPAAGLVFRSHAENSAQAGKRRARVKLGQRLLESVPPCSPDTPRVSGAGCAQHYSPNPAAVRPELQPRLAACSPRSSGRLTLPPAALANPRGKKLRLRAELRVRSIAADGAWRG